MAVDGEPRRVRGGDQHGMAGSAVDVLSLLTVRQLPDPHGAFVAAGSQPGPVWREAIRCAQPRRDRSVDWFRSRASQRLCRAAPHSGAYLPVSYVSMPARMVSTHDLVHPSSIGAPLTRAA